MKNAEKLVEFINGCHSVFHATRKMEEYLQSSGFIKLYENQKWELKEGRNYYVTRNNTSVVAFKVPAMSQVKSLNIVATHSDSPCLKVKPVADLNNPHYTRLNVEVYGGAIYSTWFDRPLSIAGRVVVKRGDQLEIELLDFDENMAVIPNVAIHQNREINNGYKYNAQTDLIPLVGLGNDEGFLLKKMASILNCLPEDIKGYDMFLYNRTKGYLWGKDNEFISAPRLDDLACAFASLMGFNYSNSSDAINIVGVFDNEEVGSMTRQGMASPFLKDVIDRIFAAFGYDESHVNAIMANSFMISADNAHAVHPNHPELYDQGNQSYLNNGIVIKRCASQSYVTDAVSEAVIRQLCDDGKVPYQFFANRSDVRGGGTQAAIASVNVTAMSCDIGLPQLAMHSSFETAGSEDVDSMINLIQEFFSNAIILDDKVIRIIH